MGTTDQQALARELFCAAFPYAPKNEIDAKVAEFLSQPAEDRKRFLSELIRTLESKGDYVVEPVDPKTFLLDPFYLGLQGEVYDTILPEFVELNSGKYVEAVLTGGVGSGKTSLALWTCAYQLYLLSLMADPHGSFGLTSSDEIEIIFQSLTASLAESVDYMRFKTLISRSPYFQRCFPFDPSRKSELHFPNRIIVKPVSGSNLATIGQNVIGGLIDELNYAAVIEKSRRSVDAGVYNQAVEQYNSISRRRLSRFYRQGFMPGILCLVSSSKYPGQFTDLKIAERAKHIAETGSSPIFLYQKTMYDVKPRSFSTERFRVFTGDEFRKPRILEEHEVVPEKDAGLIVTVPVDLRKPFEDDIVNALREIAGVSHVTKHPFFANREKLLAMFREDRKSIFSAEFADFVDHKINILAKNIVRPELPRWAHVDLAQTGDSAGVAIGYCPGFATVHKSGTVFKMPRIVLDGVLEVRPPRGDEIQFEHIRTIFHLLRDKLKVNFVWISYDAWQSVDSIQLLRQRGFTTGVRSIDRDMLPADYFKAAVLDGRIECPPHKKLWEECRDIQIDAKAQKVDHLPGKSKDLFDAVCGVVYGLSTRREIWFLHDVPIREEMVAQVAAAEQRMKSTRAVNDGWDILRAEQAEE
jgi:hypothetical protein